MHLRKSNKLTTYDQALNVWALTIHCITVLEAKPPYFDWGGVYDNNWTELNLKGLVGEITANDKDLFWCRVLLT